MFFATESGCTVHHVEEGMDTGPVQESAPVFPGDPPESLYARIQVVEPRVYPAAVAKTRQRL